MGYVKKEGSTWFYQIELGPDPDTGKRRRKKKRGFKTKKEAEKELAFVESKVYLGTYIEPSKMLFKEYIDEWFLSKKISVGPQTAKVYENYLTSRIKPSLGNIELSKINPLYLQKYINSLVEEGLAAKTVKKIYEIIRNALEHAKDLEIIPKNPAAKLKLPKDVNKEMNVWNEKEIVRFLEVACRDRIFLVFHIALSTGMRQGEILGLRWKDIDFESNLLRVGQTLLHDGKGFQAGGKTKSSSRTIPLSNQTMTLLRKHRSTVLKNKLNYGEGYIDLDLVLCTEKGSNLNPSNVRRTFRRLINEARVSLISFHGLRHTHATHLLSKGVNIKVISERLGHSNIKVTLDVYSHILPTMQEEAVKQIDMLLTKTRM